MADLLEMPDWETTAPPPRGTREKAWPAPERPAPARDVPPDDGRVKLAPQPFNPPRAAALDTPMQFQSLIDRRNEIVDGCDLFETMEQVFAAEAVLAQRLQTQRAAAAEVDASKVARNQAYAMGEAGQAFQRAADARVRSAEQNFRNAVSASEAQNRVLQPLYERITPHFLPWLQTYRDMRAWLKPDRRDPDRGAVLAALEAAAARRQDFYEGQVLAALAYAYEGDAEAADKHLASACQGYSRLRLFFSLLGPDCCEAYLLLGKPEMVKDWVMTVKRMQSGKRQSALLCWLVANAAVEAGKENEAKTFFDRALVKAGAYKAGDGGPLPEPLLGDAAFFYATATNASLRDLEKARQLLAKIPDASEHWRVFRARAAVLSAEGRPTDAEAALEAYRERAPAVLADVRESEVKDHRQVAVQQLEQSARMLSARIERGRKLYRTRPAREPQEAAVSLAQFALTHESNKPAFVLETGSAFIDTVAIPLLAGDQAAAARGMQNLGEERLNVLDELMVNTTYGQGICGPKLTHGELLLEGYALWLRDTQNEVTKRLADGMPEDPSTAAAPGKQ